MLRWAKIVAKCFEFLNCLPIDAFLFQSVRLLLMIFVLLDRNRTSLRIFWDGVTRIFARIRIMQAPLEGLRDMLTDDIENGHSVSDVEDPDQNQSFRPWSDEEDSEDLTSENSGTSSENSASMQAAGALAADPADGRASPG